jgi:RimJ/RimL family protein N-acetyltransferase
MLLFVAILLELSALQINRMNAAMHPLIRKAQQIYGRTLVLRNAATTDASFILDLRTDAQRSRYLSYTSDDVERQRAWLESYASKKDQAYFVIETLNAEPLGTVRLYDAQGNSFCWGSWILKASAPTHAAIESALMVYAYAIDRLGFQQAHFDVRKENEHVWRFHERFGAMRIGESKQDYFYQLDSAAIATSRMKYRKYLPNFIEVKEPR